jgi:hypothetical protein
MSRAAEAAGRISCRQIVGGHMPGFDLGTGASTPLDARFTLESGHDAFKRRLGGVQT